MLRTQIAWATMVAVVLCCGTTWAAKKGDRGTPVSGESTVSLTHAYRASSVIGMKVYNAANEEVGKIDDLVLDTTTGKVRYAALAVGGFLGIGEKLFAVPWHALSMKQDGNKTVVMFNIDKDRLRNAPGFDKDHWPDFGNEHFGNEIDKYYGVTVTVKTPRS